MAVPFRRLGGRVGPARLGCASCLTAPGICCILWNVGSSTSTAGRSPLPKQRQTKAAETTPAKKRTPTFLLELPLQVTAGQAKRLRAHLEAARQLYNAI